MEVEHQAEAVAEVIGRQDEVPEAVPNRARKSSSVVAIGYLTDLSDFPQSQLKYDLYELTVEELMVELLHVWVFFLRDGRRRSFL